MAWISLLGRLLLAVVFSIAAIGKLADRKGSRQALLDFGVPSALAHPLSLLLPPIELATAALLVPDTTARWGAVFALGLLGLFIGGIVFNLVRGKKPNCNCFGQLRSAPIGWSTVARNGFLVAAAAVVLLQHRESPHLYSLAVGSGSGVAIWIALGIALLALVLAVAEAWFILNLLPQQGRLLGRLEAVEGALGLAGSGLPIGQEAPEFELRRLDGDTLTLAKLLSAGHPVLLFFTNPDCTPCDEVLPDVARWQRDHADRLTLAVISVGSIDANRAKAEKHGIGTVLVQKDGEVQEAYQDETTPAAVLISADGRIASRLAFAASGVRGLLERALSGDVYPPMRLMPPASNGNHAPVEPSAPRLGERAPVFALPDLEGHTIDSAGLGGTPTLLLFWSPTCGYCQRMLPDLKAWERKRPSQAPELLVVSSGTVEANRAMGLRSRVVLDADGSAMSRFGASGTPMAILVDAGGRIASPLVVGSQQVMELAGSDRNRSAYK